MIKTELIVRFDLEFASSLNDTMNGFHQIGTGGNRIILPNEDTKWHVPGTVDSGACQETEQVINPVPNLPTKRPRASTTESRSKGLRYGNNSKREGKSACCLKVNSASMAITRPRTRIKPRLAQYAVQCRSAPMLVQGIAMDAIIIAVMRWNRHRSDQRAAGAVAMGGRGSRRRRLKPLDRPELGNSPSFVERTDTKGPSKAIGSQSAEDIGRLRKNHRCR
ncbi:MAG: hypothetical protein ISN26_02900 [Betaproteobacteria bacterium AqS2]|uniref:Uncharacterized protein n=1 Tax=Candidatus Amphirhobacter heronislandensis TaxID=1732024 RepID=A0A930XXN7_9GAMM|nr:hypothetical protein [Betaproteobacteria bacterium AqS2]